MNSVVRAKFRIASKVENSPGVVTISATAVYDPNPESENGKFWKYTPSGSISLGTVNRAAADALEVGKDYFVDFTPAE